MSGEDAAWPPKPPVFLRFGGGGGGGSGVCVMDVALPPGKTLHMEAIVLKNSYTALLSVRLQRRSPGQEGAAAKWCTAVRDRPLMSDPHGEAGAQDYFAIGRKQMRVAPDHVTAVRLILKQPSSSWSAFGLEDVRLLPRARPEPDKELSDWLLALNLRERQPHTQGPVDAASVSCGLQRMWALSQLMQSSQCHAPCVGRFDVDGCYDINLLSLT